MRFAEESGSSAETRTRERSAYSTRLAAGLPDQARDLGLTVDPNWNAQ